MPKIFLSNVPCTDEFLGELHRMFPEVDPFSLYTYLTLRKVTSDLENTLESYFASYGVSAGRFMLLLLLAANSGGMMPSELAQQCGVTQATISGLLNGLEKAQLIVRETHSHDGRAYVIKLSEKGGELLQKVKPEFLGCVDRIMTDIPLEQKKVLVEALTQFATNLKFITELKASHLAALSARAN